MIEAYPLCWPVGEPRTKQPKRSRFTGNTLAKSRDKLFYEIEQIGGTQPIISTNIPTNKDGQLRSDYQRYRTDDKGVAVYFTYKGDQICLSCDTYDMVHDNMKAIARTLEALRQISRDGVSDFLKKTFSGFKQLAAPKQREWYEVMGWEEVPTHYDTVIAQYKELAKKFHPDNGGSHEQMAELNHAYVLASKYYLGK